MVVLRSDDRQDHTADRSDLSGEHANFPGQKLLIYCICRTRWSEEMPVFLEVSFKCASAQLLCPLLRVHSCFANLKRLPVILNTSSKFLFYCVFRRHVFSPQAPYLQQSMVPIS